MSRTPRLVVLWALVCLPIAVWSSPLTQDVDKDEITAANFNIVPRPNYEGAQWIVNEADNKIIGYAPWDAVKRRWTMFNLRGLYQGFLQATIGSERPLDYRQYLWYDKSNRYMGVFIARLGGRPVSPELPYGELGGNLIYFKKGNVPIEPIDYEVITDPLEKFPAGVDVEPIPRLPTGK
jgi:hypothetical protein